MTKNEILNIKLNFLISKLGKVSSKIELKKLMEELEILIELIEKGKIS